MTDQQLDLDAIGAKATELRARLDRENPWPPNNQSHGMAEGWKNGTRNALDKLHPEKLVAEVRRLRARVWELERPAVEKQRNEVRDSYAQLAAQCREDRDHEGAFGVDCHLREREEQWKAEDAANQPTAPAVRSDAD